MQNLLRVKRMGRPRQNGREDAKVRTVVVFKELMRKEKVTTRRLLEILRCRYGIICDRKTIYSDVRAINMVVPIKTLPGRYGGYIYWDVLGEAEDGN